MDGWCVGAPVSATAPVRCWLITVGEPLPLPGEQPRLLRTGRLARRLGDAGHSVVWWSSTFDHMRKRFVRPGPATVPLDARIDLRLLHGRPYHRNVSVARLLNHHQVGVQFRHQVAHTPAPDVVLCSFPTIELADEATTYGRAHGVPVVLDVRDLWPDIFQDAVPRLLRPLARLAVLPYRRRAQRAFRSAHAVIGVSDGYLDWGLRLAGRERRSLDAVIPLGYERLAPPDAGVESIVRRQLERRGVDFGRPIVWFLGTFGRSYDLAPAITAARLLRARGFTDPLFVLSGEGEQGGAWRRLAKDLPNVVFTGWLDRHAIAVLLQHASIGLAAYARNAPQGLPNKIFEYLSAGLPVVSSLSGETATLLAETSCGITYDSSDPVQLTDVLVRLLTTPHLRASTSQAARRVFEDRYAADAIDRRLVTLLEQIALR